MKKRVLVLMLAGLGSSLTVSAQEKEVTREMPVCTGGVCQRAKPEIKVMSTHYPTWRDVPGKKNLIEVQEGNAWVQYKKVLFPCTNEKSQKGHMHHHGLNRTGVHASGRFVKYARNNNGDIINGVMNVKENNGCSSYVRVNKAKDDAAFIENVEENLEID